MNDKKENASKQTDEDFDQFTKELQNEIIGKEMEDYNDRIVSLFHDPPNWGTMEGEHVISHSYLGPCGDTMCFYLLMDGDVIKKAKFTTTGCGASVATGAQTTLLVEGKHAKEALELQPGTIDAALQGLPDDHKHCAELAVRTLRQLLERFRV